MTAGVALAHQHQRQPTKNNIGWRMKLKEIIMAMAAAKRRKRIENGAWRNIAAMALAGSIKAQCGDRQPSSLP
jgi:hypothetical protein